MRALPPQRRVGLQLLTRVTSEGNYLDSRNLPLFNWRVNTNDVSLPAYRRQHIRSVRVAVFADDPLGGHRTDLGEPIVVADGSELQRSSRAKLLLAIVTRLERTYRRRRRQRALRQLPR